MSVWQEFLIGMAYVYPIDQEEIEITDMVFKIFKILLYHAVKYEYGGWRVWIDTLSILHSRVSKEDYQLKMSKLYDDYEKHRSGGGGAGGEASSDPSTSFTENFVRLPSESGQPGDMENSDPRSKTKN